LQLPDQNGGGGSGGLFGSGGPPITLKTVRGIISFIIHERVLNCHHMEQMATTNATTISTFQMRDNCNLLGE
jgi:hypothetical protein